MRRAATPAEHALWQALRNRQLDGLKFGRQVPIGPFIADLFCASARLVIEIDGETHVESRTDPARDAWFVASGIRMLRFWNNEVLGNLGGVLLAIQAVAREPLPPAPSRKGRGKV